MNECCKETYKKVLEELYNTIKNLKMTNVYEIRGMIRIIIFNLEQEDDNEVDKC